jgi:2'-5' RNA ligase
VRLFVAVNLPPDERRAISRAVSPLAALDAPVKWVGEDNLHITLRFLGERPETDAGPIGEALARAVSGVRAFDVTLGGLGGFPDLAEPRVVWIGVEKHPALELLANDVERVLHGFGFEPELKPFQPHLTIGRAKKDAARGALRPLAAAASEVDYSGLLAVDSVDLMASTMGKDGSHYRVMRHAPLAEVA